MKIPAPKVYAWSSQRNDNPVNSEYIIMEKMSGVELESLWEDMMDLQKYEIVKQLVGFEKSFASTKFTSFGSLYYAKDVPADSDNRNLCVSEDETEIKCWQFAIGPTTNREFFDDGRGSVNIERGPCESNF